MACLAGIPPAVEFVGAFEYVASSFNFSPVAENWVELVGLIRRDTEPNMALINGTGLVRIIKSFVVE